MSNFVRIGTFKAQPDQIPSLISIFESQVQPAMRAAEGNVSASLLRQHGEGDIFLACTAWKTREAAEAYEQSGKAAENVGKLRHAFAGPPTLTTFDGF